MIAGIIRRLKGLRRENQKQRNCYICLAPRLRGARWYVICDECVNLPGDQLVRTYNERHPDDQRDDRTPPTDKDLQAVD